MDMLDLPVGFAMALAKNESAMQAFEAMTKDQKRAVLEKTHSVNSRREMDQLVAGLLDGQQAR